LTRPEHAIAIAEHKAKDLQEQANAHRTLSTSLAHDEAVINQQLTHSGDSRLARHIGKAVLRDEARGHTGGAADRLSRQNRPQACHGRRHCERCGLADPMDRVGALLAVVVASAPATAAPSAA
jgi:hypothetical protein